VKVHLTGSHAALAADVVAEAASVAASALAVRATLLETLAVAGQLRLARARRVVDVRSVPAAGAALRRLCRPLTNLVARRRHTYTNMSVKKGKGSPYSITERRVPELIPVLGSHPAGDVSHKPGGRLPLVSARPAVTHATLKRAATNFAVW